VQFRLHSTEAIRPVRPIACRISPSRPMRYATDTKYSMYNVQAVMFLVSAGWSWRAFTVRNLPRNFIHAFIRGSTDYCIGSVSAMCNIGVPYRSVSDNQPRWDDIRNIYGEYQKVKYRRPSLHHVTGLQLNVGRR
jgi:ATP-dependent phosphoenolpyruvate carboxykinase